MQKKELLSKKTILSILFLLPVTLFVLYLSICLLPPQIVQGVIPLYKGNLSMAEMHIAITNNLLILFTTLGYVILTLILAIQSIEAVAQSKKEQQIRDIEHRLENFYLPVIDTINEVKELGDELIHFVFIGHETEIGKNSKITLRRKGFDEISKYRYLAETVTLGKFEYILEHKIELIKNKELLENEIRNLKTLLETDIGNYKKTLRDLKK